MLREDAASGRLVVSSRELVSYLEIGGLAMDVTDKGTLLRVFGEKTTVTPLSKSGTKKPEALTIEEGFKSFRGVKPGSNYLRRMNYSDYIDWQAWTRKWYEKKDDAAYETFEAILS